LALAPASSEFAPAMGGLGKRRLHRTVCGRSRSFFAVSRVAEALLHPVAFVFL
jgi:hypothetical protein